MAEQEGGLSENTRRYLIVALLGAAAAYLLLNPGTLEIGLGTRGLTLEVLPKWIIGLGIAAVAIGTWIEVKFATLSTWLIRGGEGAAVVGVLLHFMG